MRVTRHSSGTVTVELPTAQPLAIGHVNPKAVVESVQGSTCALDYPWLPEVLHRALPGLIREAAKGTGTAPRRDSYSDLLQHRVRQVDGAAHARQVRSERIADAVRAEGGMLSGFMPMHRRVAIVLRGIGNRLDAHDLAKVPSARIVRRELRVLDEERRSLCPDAPSNTPRLPASNSTEEA